MSEPGRMRGWVTVLLWTVATGAGMVVSLYSLKSSGRVIGEVLGQLGDSKVFQLVLGCFVGGVIGGLPSLGQFLVLRVAVREARWVWWIPLSMASTVLGFVYFVMADKLFGFSSGTELVPVGIPIGVVMGVIQVLYLKRKLPECRPWVWVVSQVVSWSTFIPLIDFLGRNWKWDPPAAFAVAGSVVGSISGIGLVLLRDWPKPTPPPPSAPN